MKNFKDLMVGMEMTQAEVFAKIAEIVDDEALVEFCEWNIEKLQAKKQVMTKSQKENVTLKEKLLTMSFEKLTAQEVTDEFNAEFGGQFSRNKILALLKQLKDTGKILREQVGKTAVFSTIAE